MQCGLLNSIPCCIQTHTSMEHRWFCKLQIASLKENLRSHFLATGWFRWSWYLFDLCNPLEEWIHPLQLPCIAKLLHSRQANDIATSGEKKNFGIFFVFELVEQWKCVGCQMTVYTYSLNLCLCSILCWVKQSCVHLWILTWQLHLICTASVSGVHMCIFYMYNCVQKHL